MWWKVRHWLSLLVRTTMRTTLNVHAAVIISTATQRLFSGRLWKVKVWNLKCVLMISSSSINNRRKSELCITSEPNPSLKWIMWGNKICMKHGDHARDGGAGRGGTMGKWEQYVSMVTPLKVTEMPGHPAWRGESNHTATVWERLASHVDFTTSQNYTHSESRALADRRRRQQLCHRLPAIALL